MNIYTTTLNIVDNTIERHSDEYEDEADSLNNAANHMYVITYPNVCFDDFTPDCIYGESIVSQEEADDIVFKYAINLMGQLIAALKRHGGNTSL